MLFLGVQILCQPTVMIEHHVVAINPALISRYDFLNEYFVIVGLFKKLQANVHSISLCSSVIKGGIRITLKLNETSTSQKHLITQEIMMNGLLSTAHH